LLRTTKETTGPATDLVSVGYETTASEPDGKGLERLVIASRFAPIRAFSFPRSTSSRAILSMLRDAKLRVAEVNFRLLLVTTILRRCQAKHDNL